MQNTYKNNEDESRAQNKKVWKFRIILIFITLGFLAVITKLFIIQVYESEKYKQRAKIQHEAKIKLSAERGDIYDRNGKLLVSTVQGISIAADPTVLEHKKELCGKLEKIIDIPSAQLLDKINGTKGTFVWLARGLSADIAIALDSINYKGFIKVLEPRRNYLYGSTATQLIGCTNIDNKGITGLELGWDSLLTSISGEMIMQRDGKGRLHPSADLPIIPAQQGKSLVLTIDVDLQNIVEYELKAAVLNSKAESGTVLALDPKTGEILAVASYPTFDPANPAEHVSGSMHCRAVSDMYYPGSTFKLVTAAAALDDNLITPETMVDGHGGEIDFGDYKISDDHGIGKVTFADALAYSSNVVFSTVGNNIPDNTFYKYIRDFGFGMRLGVDIPQEASGKIKKPAEFDPTTKRFMGFGYGLTVTPLQLVNAYSAIANDGVLMKPHIVKTLLDNDGEPLKEFPSEKIRRVVSEKTAQTLTKMLLNVVGYGTGKAAKIAGINIAGKTGTSQILAGGNYSKTNYIASFAGFFPAEAPKLVLLVVLNNLQSNYYGGQAAAPVFRNIVQRWLSVSPEFNPKAAKHNMPSLAFLPDLTGMRPGDAQKFLNNFELIIAPGENATGIIISQFPKPGAQLKAGDTVFVKLINYAQADTSAKKQAFPKPDLSGLSSSKAIAILQSAGIKPRIVGSGTVRAQQWSKDPDGKPVCTIICR